MDKVEFEGLEVGDTIRVSGVMTPEPFRTSFNLSTSADTWANLLHIVFQTQDSSAWALDQHLGYWRGAVTEPNSRIQQGEDYSFDIELVSAGEYVVRCGDRFLSFTPQGDSLTTDARCLSINQQFFGGDLPVEILLIKKDGSQQCLF